MKTLKSKNWFSVDKTGLTKLQNEKDKFFIVKELVSNCFDEDITICNVSLEYSNGVVTIEVYDDSKEGFMNLSDAYTLFAESYKKGNAKQRGRFNIGEKFALSMFNEASITSTKGKIIFHKNGDRTTTSTKNEFGTLFQGKINMTKKEMLSIIEKCELIIPPKNIKFDVCNTLISRPDVSKVFQETLPSVTTDSNGNLTPTSRKTDIELFETDVTDVNYICELGIPVVETDICFTINVNQKIPLNKDRDNVSPSYLRKLKTCILNNTADELDDEEVTTSWATEAMEDAEPDAVKSVIDKRFGEDAVVFDPTDPEANRKAIADGVEVITGSVLSKKAWDNVRVTRDVHQSFAKPSGREGKYASPEFGDGAKSLAPEKWTDGMKEVVSFSKEIHQYLFNESLSVVIHDGSGASAMYGRGRLQFFYKVLGKRWFDLESNKESIVRLIIHEFGHYYSGNHLSEEYYDGLCKIGAKLYCRK